jgi:hypothetical protein
MARKAVMYLVLRWKPRGSPTKDIINHESDHRHGSAYRVKVPSLERDHSGFHAKERANIRTFLRYAFLISSG